MDILKRLWKGGADVTNAHETLCTLDGKPDLGGRKSKKLKDARETVRNHLLNRVFATIGSVGVATATVAGVSYFNVKPTDNVPADSSDKTMEPPQAATPQTNAPEIPSGFALGDKSFEFDASTTPQFRLRVRDLMQKSYPEIQALLGEPSKINCSVGWTIHMNPPGRRSEEDPINNKINIAVDASDSLAIHELSHLYQGVDFPEINWIREGSAVAIANIVPPKIGKKPWHKDESTSEPDLIFGSNFSLYAGLHPAQNYDTSSRGLLTGRYLLAGRLWEEIEESRPGSLKKFTKNMRAFFAEHSKQEAESILIGMKGNDLLKRFLGNKAPKKYQNLIDPSGPKNAEDVAIGSYQVVSNHGPMLFASAVRRFPYGQEEILPPRQGMLITTNPNTGTSLELPFQTSREGLAQFSLDGITSKIGEAEFYEVTMKVEGCKDEHVTIPRRGLR